MWGAVLVASVGAYLLKLLGVVVPQGWLENPRVRRISLLLPIALLSALTAVLTFGAGPAVVLDARAAAVGVAAVALVLRAPFLLVVVLAAGTAALLRAVAG